MHVSLDSALGRQRRLNSVGESVLQIAPNAAAAYSLRSLTGGDPTVVRVRRGSDNHEQDFTASEVSAGALTSFVNAQVVAPLDIQALEADGRTGDFLIAKAAYSLRSLGTRQATLAATGDTVARADGKFVAQVRRSSDDALKSFTAAEVTDGTLRNFCLNDDADIISFADAGLAGSPAANKRMYFDGDGDAVIIGNISSLKVDDFEVEAFINIPKFSDLTEFGAIYGSWSSGILFLVKANGTLDLWVKLPSGFQFKTSTASLPINSGYVKVLRNSTTGDITFSYKESAGNTYIQLGAVVSSTAGVPDYGSSNIRIGGDSGRNFKGILSNVTAFDGGVAIASWNGYGNTSADWTDQIGSSNGTVAGSSALFTGQGFDGFVKTWYDQSVTNEAGDTATGNHATQATAASQPKIVSAGALVTEGSLPTIEFDSVDDYLDSTSDISSPLWSFITHKATKDNSAVFATKSGDRWLGRRSTGAFIQVLNSVVSGGSYPSSTIIRTDEVNGSDSKIFSNGTSIATGDNGLVTLSNFGRIGAQGQLTSTKFLGGNIQELIVYTSDQTDNRTALEANIGETYSITGIPAYDNEVDGFVETWYDQSGNSKDATQATAGSQPKIVSAGSLITGGLDFDAPFNVLETSVVPPNAATLIGVVNFDASGSTQLIVGAKDSTNQRSYLGQLNSNVSVLGNASGTLTGGSISAGADFLLFGVHDVDKRLLSTNGTVVSNTSGLASNNTTQGYSIGAQNTAGTNDNFVNGKIAEVIIYSSDQSANRVALETNINSQYSIF